MLTFMLNEELANDARAKLERINSEVLTTPEQVKQLQLSFNHRGELVISYLCADGFSRALLSFDATKRQEFFTFEDWIQEQIYKEPPVVLGV